MQYYRHFSKDLHYLDELLVVSRDNASVLLKKKPIRSFQLCQADI